MPCEFRIYSARYFLDFGLPLIIRVRIERNQFARLEWHLIVWRNGDIEYSRSDGMTFSTLPNSDDIRNLVPVDVDAPDDQMTADAKQAFIDFGKLLPTNVRDPIPNVPVVDFNECGREEITKLLLRGEGREQFTAIKDQTRSEELREFLLATLTTTRDRKKSTEPAYQPFVEPEPNA